MRFERLSPGINDFILPFQVHNTFYTPLYTINPVMFFFKFITSSLLLHTI